MEINMNLEYYVGRNFKMGQQYGCYSARNVAGFILIIFKDKKRETREKQLKSLLTSINMNWVDSMFSQTALLKNNTKDFLRG